ncbi:MAG: hypothetical protein JWQ38_3079 [Flavipsychrobacter sp.]|nr:hypothetical protein [Flavipsychrobacter sp.]
MATLKMYVSIAIVFATTCTVLNAHAQEKGRKNHKSKTSYKEILLPDFLNYEKVKKGDTTFSYDCYDHNNKKINVDTISTINSVDDIFYFKSYYQRPFKEGSAISPPYLSNKLYTYERTSETTWVGFNRMTKERTGLKDVFKTIVRKDTVTVTDPGSGVAQMIIHKYYKTEQVPFESVPNTHHH